MALKHEFTTDGNAPHSIFNIGRGTATGLAGYVVGLFSGLLIAWFFFWMGSVTR